MTKSAPQHPTSRTLDAGALKALAHPLRVRIFDILSTAGPQTASSLAALVGETSGATSYHLRALAAHDLIREVEGRGSGRERWWERPEGRVDFAGPGAQSSPAGRAAAQIATAEFARRRHETLMEYLNRPEKDDDGEWTDVGMVLTSHIDMTAVQALALQQEIAALIEQAHDRCRGQSGPDVRRVSVRADIFDVAVTPVQGNEAYQPEKTMKETP